MSQKRVAIIGSGSSGLPAIKTCLDHNLDTVCYEKWGDTGGLWHEQDPLPQHLNLEARVYKGLIQNACKHFYCYSDFPMLEGMPYHLKSKEAKTYLEAYADHFDLKKNIRFNREATKVAKSNDYDRTGNWTVTSVDAVTKEDIQTEVFNSVILASGYFTKARIPMYPNQDNFNGTVIHSGRFWDSKAYEDRTVVIAGGGFSTVDLAVILAQNAKQIYIVTRRGFWVLPLIINRKSWEFMSYNRAFIEENTADKVIESMEKLVNERFDHNKLGMKPSYKYCETSISNNIDEWISCGKIKIIHGEIDHFTNNGVTLKDGQSVTADDVIFATGYNPDCPWLDAPDMFPSTENINSYPHWEYVLPISQTHPTLFMVGLHFTSGSLPPIAELQARMAAGIITNNIKLPSEGEMMKWFENDKKYVLETFGKYPAMTNSYDLEVEISKIIGCYPEIEKIAEKDEILARRCYNGPLLPAQFRLLGPHTNWDLAKKIIMETEGNEEITMS